jgi:hypothetical protein
LLQPIIQAILYGMVHGQSDVVDFTFVDGEDIERSRVGSMFAQNMEWARETFVEFRITTDESEWAWCG